MSAPFYEQKEKKMIEYMVAVFIINMTLNMMGVFQ
tara:strand:+ start:23 stop:127 length:105 start_codon:yes stop_codon:yes gene_type:complete